MRESNNHSGFTQVPNIIFELNSQLPLAAQSILSVIVRQTLGWNNKDDSEWDSLSFSQFRQKTGIASNETIYNAIELLLRLQIIKVRKSPKKATQYSLDLENIQKLIPP